MKPILFNTEMVRALLEGRKTVTRRVVKDPYYIDNANVCGKSGMALHKGTDCTHGMPYPDSPYHPSDILWVRETWMPVSATVDFWKQGDPTAIDDGFGCQYRADGEIVWSGDFKPQNDEFYTTEIRYGEKWHPSINMPKQAARLFLRVTGVRVERLRPMDLDDFEAEGLSTICGLWTATEMFADLWDSTIKPTDLPLYGWEANPWVWVIEFERISQEAAIGGGGDG